MVSNEQQALQLIQNSIRAIPDYPKKGIIFRDVTTLVANFEVFSLSIKMLAERYRHTGITKVVGTEARGFLFGAPVALALGVGFVPVRKPGKLPYQVIKESYTLEYGEDQLEIHTDAITRQDRVLVIDDLLATGGTIEATIKLIKRLGGEVHHAAFVIELLGMKAAQEIRTKLGVECYSLIQFP